MKRTRKLLALIISLILALSVLLVIPFTASAESEGLFTYDVYKGEASITGLLDSDYSGAVTIPSIIGGYPVTSIEYQAFYRCTGLTSITIPEGVTSIGWEAFYRCTGLAGIIIPDSVISIGGDAFSNTTWYNNQPDGLVYAGKVVYRYKGTCPESITIKDGTLGIAGKAFSNCAKLKSVTIPDGVMSIGNSAFAYCTGLTSVTIPNSVIEIGLSAFDSCAGLTNINIPDKVTKICEWTFSYCVGLTSITIPDSVTVIRDWAFDGCTGLTSITIPNNVIEIGSRAFENCSGLESITVDSGNTAYHSAGNCLIETNSKTLISGCKNSIIPTNGSVTSISTCAFEGCTGLTSITIPDSVSKIGNGAFSGCTGLESITVESGNTVYHSTGNCLMETESKTLIFGCNKSVIPSDGSVTSISSRAFEGCAGLKSITIPDGVTSIGSYAFYECAGLTSIIMADSVISIGNSAFSYCTELKSINIPDSVTSIGYCAFEGCSGLTDITISCGLTFIDTYTFKGCTGLKSINIPDSVTSIYQYAFEGCTELISVSIPDSVTSICDWAFYQCRGLTNVAIPDSIISISDGTFYCCVELTSVTISDSVTSIGEGAFGVCENLEDVYYSGTEQQKANINIEDFNDDLLNATWHYNYVPPCNHSKTEIRDAKAATCTEAGYTGDTYCLSCGAELAEGEAIAALGHDFSEYVSDNNATCTHDGTKTAKCSRCDVTDTVKDEGSMLAHTVGEWMFDEVSHHRHCEMCGEDVDAGTHTYQWVLITPATMKSTGLKKEICSACGYESGNEQVIPKREDHTPGDINGDGSLNNKDLTRLFQYLSDWDVQVDAAALDVNGDGSVNNKDLTRLFQYLSDWDVEIF